MSPLPGNFPRFRRLRGNETIRSLVCETELSVSNFIYPIFITEGEKVRLPVPSMPGVFRLSIDEAVKECLEVRSLGIPAVLLFGIPDAKDDTGSGAYSDNGIIQRSIKAIKQEAGSLLIITDVCLCEYTSHGHCGIVKDGKIVNDESVNLIAKTALSHARAGTDMVAPSDMFDRRVASIRNLLDDNGFTELPIMSYAAKFASSFYGPFRDAAGSTPLYGDRRSHQMDPANAREAMREIEEDIREGTDIVMVKPALAYLDIIRRVRERFNIPVAAYNVSGEYSMIKAAAANGWIDGERVMMETLLSIKRAGADMIITYFAKEASKIIKE